MADPRTVAECLALLSEAQPAREISERTLAVYAMALDDLSDDALRRATGRALRHCRFFPTPAELREYAGANTLPLLDLDALLDQIRGLCRYLPTVGTIPPRVAEVRERCGESVARAYGACGGGTRLLCGNETTQAIALREFTVELHAELRRVGACHELLPASSSGAPTLPMLPPPPDPDSAFTLFARHYAP